MRLCSGNRYRWVTWTADQLFASRLWFKTLHKFSQDIISEMGSNTKMRIRHSDCGECDFGLSFLLSHTNCPSSVKNPVSTPKSVQRVFSLLTLPCTCERKSILWIQGEVVGWWRACGGPAVKEFQLFWRQSRSTEQQTFPFWTKQKRQKNEVCWDCIICSEISQSSSKIYCFEFFLLFGFVVRDEKNRCFCFVK